MNYRATIVIPPRANAIERADTEPVSQRDRYIAAINTDGIDVNLTYRGFDIGGGRLGFTWSNTFLLNYDVLVPGPTVASPDRTSDRRVPRRFR